MSGHSKWAKIHRKKGAADAKKGAVFTKISNLITIAAKRGGDPESNFALRLAMEKARSVNMPKDNIERAIARATGEADGKTVLEEATYEIFGPAGSVFVLEAITDNKNRTLSEIKTIINKNGGRMGGASSVLWMFSRLGLVIIDKKEAAQGNLEELELNLIDAGASDIDKADDDWEIYTAPDDLQKIIQLLKDLHINIKESNLVYRAKDELHIADEENRQKIENLMAGLDEVEDVSSIYTNANW